MVLYSANERRHRGFTLLELLIVIGVIARAVTASAKSVIRLKIAKEVLTRFWRFA
jgi:prepilin-type N-terminal cleavage/methylation domain-containing protein